jgi:hypothetical protein
MPAFVAQSWPPEAGESNIAAKKHEKASKNGWNCREKEQAQPSQERTEDAYSSSAHSLIETEYESEGYACLRSATQARLVRQRLRFFTTSRKGSSRSEYWQKHETLCWPAHRANRRGFRLPIPSEPAPCHRPRSSPQGATPVERFPP